MDSNTRETGHLQMKDQGTELGLICEYTQERCLKKTAKLLA